MSKLNVVIPMAGLGSRFKSAGYNSPKPLVNILGKPMIQWVVENLKMDANYIFIVQKAHIVDYQIDRVLTSIIPDCKIAVLNRQSAGAACSVLFTSNYINNNDPLLIVNSDNLIEWDAEQTMASLGQPGVDGGIIVFNSTGPKWSYARVDSENNVLEVAEKVQISDLATTGHYYWRHGADFVSCAKEMIARDIKYSGEFYIAPVYNQAVEAGLKIITIPATKFWSVGTPEDLKYFLENCDTSKVK
jgi:dTDP-glucose pyrophosphorylase